MIKKLSMNGVFDRINNFNSKPSLDAQKPTTILKSETLHSDALPTSVSPNLEESVSKIDTVNSKHCQNPTVSKADPVKKVQQDQISTASRTDAVSDSHRHGATLSNPDTVDNLQQDQKLTPSKNDSVKQRHGQTATVSEFDSIEAKSEKRRAPRGNFTAVPNSILRTEGAFDEPLDFMIFMHLLTYSYGFGKDTVNMGQDQLVRFTGAAKNTVKKSLERLKAQGLIELVEEFEHSRVTRKWRICLPELPHPDPEPTKPEKPKPAHSGSNADTVKIGHCQTPTQTVSNADSVTGSKFDPYKENITKKGLKKSLSEGSAEVLNLDELPERIRKYFSELSPRAKFEREWKAFSELKSEFQTADIESAFAWLKRNGLPDSGKPAYSPMGFLRVGFNQVSHQVKKSSFKQLQSTIKTPEHECDPRAFESFAFNLHALRTKLQFGANCA